MRDKVDRLENKNEKLKNRIEKLNVGIRECTFELCHQDVAIISKDARINNLVWRIATLMQQKDWEVCIVASDVT